MAWSKKSGKENQQGMSCKFEVILQKESHLLK